MRKYVASFVHAAKGFAAFRMNFVMRTVFLLFTVWLTVTLWRAIYAENGYSQEAFALVAWPLLFARMISLSLTNIHTELANDIRTGNIALQIGKPYHFIAFKLMGSLGRIAYPLLINSITMLGVGFLLIGGFYPGFSVAALVLCLLLVGNGIVIDWFVKFIIAGLAFWVHETKGILIVYHRLLMFLGGVMIPFDLFPGWIRAVAGFLPIQYAVNLPSQTMVVFSAQAFAQLLGMQLFYIAVLWIITGTVYRMGVKKLHVNGG